MREAAFFLTILFFFFNLTILGCGTGSHESIKITVDTTPPLLAMNPVKSPTVSTSQTITGTTEARAKVYVTTDTDSGGGYATVDGTTWSYPLTGLILGVNNVTVKATDAALNIAAVTASIELFAAETIAHRGASLVAPENTLAAFNLAWQQGVDEVELDIHQSQDNRIMVIHDTTTGRTAGTDYTVKSTTSDLLRTLDVGSFKGSQYAGERIPFLEEVIATIPPGKKLLVEIKTGVEMLPFLQQVIVNSGKKDQIEIHSFSLTVVSQFKKLMPEVPAYYIVGSVTDAQQVVQNASTNGLDGLSVEYNSVNPTLIALADAAHLKCLPWVVDDPVTASTLMRYGVKGIMTNDPDLLQKISVNSVNLLSLHPM